MVFFMWSFPFFRLAFGITSVLVLLRFWYYMFVRTLEIVLSFRDLGFVSQLGIKG